MLSGCQSIEPIVKIGLIAPFEGLYRDSGYQALAGLRAGITDCSPNQVAVLPQALDDSTDPRQAARAAAKLAVDPAVRAMIGPLFPTVQPDTEGALPPTAPIWLWPYHIHPTGRFTTGESPIWLQEMGAYILHTASGGPAGGERGAGASVEESAEESQAAVRPTVERVLIVGLPPDVLPSWQGSDALVRVDDPALALDTLAPGDGVLWLDLPHRAAPWLRTAWQEQPELPFWLGTQSGADVLAAHLYAQTPSGQISGSSPGQSERAQPIDAPVYWLYWIDSEYNQWLKLHAPTTPAAYHIYRATCELLASPDGTPSPDVNASANVSAWQLQQQPLRPGRE